MEQFKKVTEKNIREYADLKDGYASGRFDYQTGGEQQSLVPFEGELDSAPSTSAVGLVPFDGALDSPADTKKFKSGTAFKDTKDLIPSYDDLKKWWAEMNTDKGSTTEALNSLIDSGLKVGTGVLDVAGAIPSMLVGGIAGVGSAVKNMDATKGLETAGEVMHALTPSTLMGHVVDAPHTGKQVQDSTPYKAVMAPLTAAMDTLNAVPTGYGEMLNAAGFDKAAAQVTDAGKLAIMAVLGTKGSMHMYKSLTGKDAASVADASTKLEALMKEPEAAKAIDPAAPEHSATAAHADDFAAINPYDVGGHVTESDLGRPSTIDNVQGELFGDRSLQDPQALPKSPVDSLLNTPDNAIPYDRLELGGEASVPGADLGMPMVPDRLSLVPKEETATPVAEAPAPRPIIDATEAKAREQQLSDAFLDRPVDKEAGFAEMERRQSADYSRMEAQRELDFNAETRRIEEQSVMRRAFLDKSNLDFQEATRMGDKSLMGQNHTIEMRAWMRRGDINGALKVLADSHPIKAYRDLATYLTDKLDGLKVVMHDEGVLRHGDRDVTGYYDPSTHTVGLSGLGASSPHTVLHELTHAVTSHFINTRPGDLRVMGLKNLYNQIAGRGDFKKFTGIVNVKEFVAEAFSNPAFQEHLKGINMNNKSVWQRFVDGVKSIFGLRTGIETPLTNAFEHSMDLSKQIIEAQDGKGTPMEQFKRAGVPGKLADLMATQRPIPPQPSIKADIQRLKVPGLEGPISDFTFYDKPMSEIVEMAKTSIDIPNTAVEKMAQQLQGGALFESLKTRNPVVKGTYERITRATQEATRLIKKNLTDPETGLKGYMRALDPQEKGVIHAAMMLDEGQRVRSSAELSAANFSEKQISYYNKYRELSDQFFKDINERRVAMGMTPMDARVAHMAGRFMGDFSRFVFDADGKIVGRIADNTKWGLNKASAFIAEQHPDWSLGAHEYNTLGQGKNPGDRFTGLMEALNFITKTDADAKALFDSYQAYMQKDAVNFLNATRHAKDKVKDAGGIIGSQGHKPWLDNVKNAKEGMKAQLAYFEQGYQWMAMEKAVTDLKPLLGDEAVVLQNPNATKYSKQYLDHALGRNQGPLADAANWTASKIGEFTGVGHSNMFKVSNQAKHLIMQKFMGLLNIPFTITQMMQPLQVHPAMITLLKNRGLEFSALDAQVKAATTYLNSLSEGRTGRLSDFEKSAMKYADEMGIVDVKMADHTKNINENKFTEAYNAVADVNITVPERLTRGTSFLFYSHLLKDAGVPVKDVFGAAENMTNMTMVNYHPIERPMGYAKLGWLGDVASTLTRYKHNQGSQLAFYAREGIRADHGIKSSVPLAAFLGTSIAFGGAMGFFAFQEADSIYQLFTEHITKKPDTLTNVVLSSGMPEVLSHGIFSTLGMDMTSRFSNANMIPNSIPEALMPYGSAVLDMMQNSTRLAMDPTSKTKQKQTFKSFAPQSIAGFLENTMFTEKEGDKNLYYNGTDGPNIGKGRVYRSDEEMAQRTLGFRSVRESKELAKNYSDNQIEKANKNIVDRLLTKAKYAALDGKLDEATFKGLVEKATTYGEDPNSFVSKMVTWEEYRHLSQEQQNMLQNALGGFKGATNIKAGR